MPSKRTTGKGTQAAAASKPTPRQRQQRDDYGFHPLRYPGDRWTCPLTGAIVAKDLGSNIRQRRNILVECDKDAGFRRAIISACSESCLLWMNWFGWTYVPIHHKSDGTHRARGTTRLPFISWAVQDSALEVMMRRAGFPILPVRAGDDMALKSVKVRKSRDMGATWLALGGMAWVWLFRPEVSMLISSREEELVESTGRVAVSDRSLAVSGNPDTLFWKLDYLIQFLPPWLKPARVRTESHLQNLVNGSVIDGVASTKDLGVGGRRQIMLLDEAAKIKNLEDIEHNTTDTSPCRWFVSTVHSGSCFSELELERDIEVVSMGWWDHPDKASDLEDGTPGRTVMLDPDRGKEVVTGPWREAQKRRRTIEDVAENIDMDDESAGRIIFNLGTLQRHRMLHASQPPFHTGRLVFDTDDPREIDLILKERDGSRIRWEETGPGDRRGRWRLWTPLYRSRVDQRNTPCLAADVSWGLGASNSVIACGWKENGEKIAEFADASMEPSEFARQLMAAGIWFGGARKVGFIGWEANGPGQAVARVVNRIGYPWMYRSRATGRTSEAETDRLGWVNTPDGKIDMALQLADWYKTGRIIDHSPESIDEAKRWVRYENNGIGPARLEYESGEAKKTHGDRVVATMLLVECFRVCPFMDPPPLVPPPGSPAERLAEITKRQKADREGEWTASGGTEAW